MVLGTFVCIGVVVVDAVSVVVSTDISTGVSTNVSAEISGSTLVSVSKI